MDTLLYMHCHAGRTTWNAPLHEDCVMAHVCSNVTKVIDGGDDVNMD